eukprot:s1248_g18.t1
MGQNLKGMPSAEQRLPIEVARLPRRPPHLLGASVPGYMWDARRIASCASSFGTGQVVLHVADMDVLVLKAMQELGVHPNLLAVLDLFVAKGGAPGGDRAPVSLVTQLCPGGHLADAMALRHFASPALRRLSPGVSLALAWISQLLSALAFLHEGRIIHRCIQPESCILDNTTLGRWSSRIVESNMVLGNFSQSSRLHLDNIMIDRPEGPLPGSASYMAPELKRQAMSSTGRPIEPWRCPKEVQEFIATLLQVDYVQRADAQSALAEAQRLCRSLAETQLDDSEKLPMLFPMYTVSFGTLLEMRIIEPHEALKARGVLVEFQMNMGNAAFVSHQWVASSHPDPECRQMKVLQDALKNMMGNLKSIPSDVISEAQNPNLKPLPTSKILAEPLFFWYDYFSCPQKGALSEASAHDAINSIPAYVDECSFFFALVPVLENPSGTNMISPLTWNSRGWCRLERSCRELSQSHSWIQVKGPNDLQLISSAGASITAGSGPVGEGAFTVPEDRLKLGPVLMKALKRKLLSLLKAQDLPSFRFLLNHQAFVFRGLDCIPLEPIPGFEQNHVDLDFSPLVMKFFHQNGFRSIREMDSAGFSPLHYAALKGDPSLVQDLLALQADPNQVTRKVHPGLGFESGVSPLSISCSFRNNEAIQLLISAKGRVTSRAMIHRPLHCAAAVNNTEAIQILLRARCPLDSNALGSTALESATGFGSLEALDELLRYSNFTSLDATCALCTAAPGFGGAELVQRLVEMRADVNDQTVEWYKRTTLYRALYTFMVLQHRFHKVKILNKILYHAKGATPLMLALLSGNDEFAAALIAAGARLNLPNSRGLTAADLIRRRSGPEFLLEACEGRARNGVLVTPELLEASCGEAHLMDPKEGTVVFHDIHGPKETLQHMSVSPSGRYVIAVSEKVFWRWSDQAIPEAFDVEMFDLEELDASQDDGRIPEVGGDEKSLDDPEKSRSAQEIRYVETSPDRVLMVGEREVTDVLLFCGDSGTRIVKLVVTQHLKFQSPIRCQPKTPDAFLALSTASEPEGEVDLLLRAEKGNSITSLVACRLEQGVSTASDFPAVSLDNSGIAPPGAEPSGLEAGYPPGLPMPRYSRPPGLPSPPNRMMQEKSLSNPMVSFDVPPGLALGADPQEADTSEAAARRTVESSDDLSGAGKQAAPPTESTATARELSHFMQKRADRASDQVVDQVLQRLPEGTNSGKPARKIMNECRQIEEQAQRTQRQVLKVLERPRHPAALKTRCSEAVHSAADSASFPQHLGQHLADEPRPLKPPIVLDGARDR